MPEMSLEEEIESLLGRHISNFNVRLASIQWDATGDDGSVTQVLTVKYFPESTVKDVHNWDDVARWDTEGF